MLWCKLATSIKWNTMIMVYNEGGGARNEPNPSWIMKLRRVVLIWINRIHMLSVEGF